MSGDAFERLRERLAHVDPDQGWFFARIAEQVAAQRKARGLSQAELAELTGTTQSAIARLESGGRPPRIDTLLRIARSEEHTSELQSRGHLVCRLLLEKKKYGRDAPFYGSYAALLMPYNISRGVVTCLF